MAAANPENSKYDQTSSSRVAFPYTVSFLQTFFQQHPSSSQIVLPLADSYNINKARAMTDKRSIRRDTIIILGKVQHQ